MKHDFSDVVPENFYTTDGHINLDALVTREEHLYALSIAQRALAGIEEQLASSVGGSDEWKYRANAAHKRWTWLIARIRERLSIFKAREKNVKLSRSILIRKYLVKELKKHVSRAVYKECEKLAKDLAREETEALKVKLQ
ncbi:hypothetical protein SODG_004956 [Sodalis praecaptivus]